MSSVRRPPSIVVAFIAAGLLAIPGTASTQQASPPGVLVDLFPHDDMEVPGDSAIVLIFSELMDALSVLKSINVTLDASIGVSVELSGECGDGSTLILSPTAGLWQPGNYTISFTAALRTATDLSIPRPTLVSRFNVTDRALPIVGAVAIDLTKVPQIIRDGQPVLLQPGSINVTFEFSFEIDVVDFLKMLESQGRDEKPNECGSRALSITLSLSLGASVAFTLVPTGVVDRLDRNRTIPSPFNVRLQSVSSTIQGLIIDRAGNPLPGATVTLTPESSSQILTQRSGSNGAFAFANVLPGAYRICATQVGFNETCTNIVAPQGSTSVTPLVIGPIAAGDYTILIVAIVLIGVVGLVVLVVLRRRGSP